MEPRGPLLGARPDLGAALQGGLGGFLKGDPGVSPKGAGLGVSPKGAGMGGFPRGAGMGVSPRGAGLGEYPRVAGLGVGHKPGLEEAVSRVRLKAGLDPGIHWADRGRPWVDPDSTLDQVPGDPSVPWSQKLFL